MIELPSLSAAVSSITSAKTLVETIRSWRLRDLWLVPLPVAALRSYEKTREADLWTFATNPREDRLYHHVLVLLSDARDYDETVYGCRVPSRKHTAIPKSEIRPGRVTKDGLALLNDNEQVDWEALAVTRLHLRRCIKRRKATLAAVERDESRSRSKMR